MQDPNRTTWRIPILLTSSFIAMLVGGSSAQGAAYCLTEESVHMTNPVVTVIEGQGDVAEEQAHWSALKYSILSAPLRIALGERGFELERVP